jgi:hypothetical protein
MKIHRILSKRKICIGFLAGLGVYLFSWAPSILADDNQIDPETNIIAVHDSSYRAYRKECKECHSDISNAQSLDPSIPAAHKAMFPWTPGKAGDDKQCRWCHKTVDLVEGSGGGLKKQVDVILCALCHGPFERIVQYQDKPEPVQAKQFYQGGIDPDDPNGPALYDLACASCHKGLSNSEVGGESASEIQEKIDEDEGGMGPLSVLSTVEIQAIADALAGAGSEHDEHDEHDSDDD